MKAILIKMDKLATIAMDMCVCDPETSHFYDQIMLQKDCAWGEFDDENYDEDDFLVTIKFIQDVTNIIKLTQNLKSIYG